MEKWYTAYEEVIRYQGGIGEEMGEGTWEPNVFFFFLQSSFCCFSSLHCRER